MEESLKIQKISHIGKFVNQLNVNEPVQLEKLARM